MERQGQAHGVEGDRIRVLFVPEPDGVKTSERAPAVMRAIRERHEVVALRPPWDRILYNPRRPLGPRLVLYVLDKVLLGVRGLLLGRRHRVDVVVCETAHHALAGVLVARVLGARCIWDSHGNGKLFYESLGRGPWSIRLVTAFERFLGARVDDLITVSEVDAAAYRHMGLPSSKIHVIPLCVDLKTIDSAVGRPPDGEARVEGPPVLLFFGSFGYEPNRQALLFINDRLAPRLEERGVRCEIHIAGRDIPQMKFHPLVHPVGFVPDIYAQIRDATVCIVPVRRGVGVLTKVIDSMAVGTPVVAFDFAARGIPEVRDGVHAFVAETEDEFVRCVTRALSDEQGARAMSRRARELVERTYDWDRYTGQLDAIVRGMPTNDDGGGAA